MSHSSDAGLVTPEAVRVDLHLAGVGTRTAAIVLDLFVMGIAGYGMLLFGVLFFAAFAANGGPAWLGIVLALAAQFALLWGYPVLSETVFGGRTIGKLALGLRVVTVDGAPIRFRHAAIRGLLAYVDLYATGGLVALVTALLSRRGQRLGDLAAGTVVVRERRGRTAAQQPVRWYVPPQDAAYASTLDVRALTAQDYSLVRELLLRSANLRPDDLLRVGTELADVLAAKMRHTIPAGTHPRTVLLCVAALLQDRGSPSFAPSASTPPRPPAWPAPPIDAGPGPRVEPVPPDLGVPPRRDDGGFVAPG